MRPGADIMKNNHCNAGGKQIEQVWKDNIIYVARALSCVQTWINLHESSFFTIGRKPPGVWKETSMDSS